MVEVVHSEGLAYSRALPRSSSSVGKHEQASWASWVVSAPDAGGIRGALYVALAVHRRIIQNVL